MNWTLMNPFFAESKRCLTTFQSPSIRKTLQQNLNVIILEEIFLNFGWFSYHIIGKTKLDDLPFVGTYSSWLINGWILSFSQHNPSDLTIGTMAAWGGRQWVRPMWHGPAEAGDPGFFLRDLTGNCVRNSREILIKMEIWMEIGRENHGTKWGDFPACLITWGSPKAIKLLSSQTRCND